MYKKLNLELYFGGKRNNYSLFCLTLLLSNKELKYFNFSKVRQNKDKTKGYDLYLNHKLVGTISKEYSTLLDEAYILLKSKKVLVAKV